MDEYLDVPEKPKLSLWERLSLAADRLKEKMVFLIGETLPPEETRLETYHGSAVYVCPRCGEFVYYEKQCISCGQRFLPGAKTIGGMLDERTIDS